MNKMLVAICDTETAANAGLKALRQLNAEGDITLYAAGVLLKDEKGNVSVKKPMDQGPLGMGVGLAVGSLIGLLGGPAGLIVGAVAGTAAGAVRDFWRVGVSLDFIEEVQQLLKPGKVALVAEIEEEWVTPVDAALEAAGCRVFRRTRGEVAAVQFDHDIVALRSEVRELEAEALHASGAARVGLQSRLDSAKGELVAAVNRAKQRVDTLKLEGDAKTVSLKAQMSHVTGEVKSRIEDRLDRVKHSYHLRGAALSQAWTLTKEALAV